MTDKVQKIKEWVKIRKQCTMAAPMKFYCKEAESDYNILCTIEKILDSLQEDSKFDVSVEEAMAEVEEKAKAFTEAHKGEDSEQLLAQMRGEEPVSEDLDSFATKYAQDKPYPVTVCQAVRVGANWQKEKDEKEKSDIYDIAVDVGRKLGETDMKLQMMKEAIFCPVTKRDVGISLSITNRDVIKDTKDLSYLKVIIIKED